MAVNSKQKGASFERYICKALSLWITGGQRTDTFWRSSLSGGRATVQRKKGVSVRQAGDICAVSPEGHAFCDRYYVECKHCRNLAIEGFLISGRGLLAKYWRTAVKEARSHGREPMLIFRQNHTPDLVMLKADGFAAFSSSYGSMFLSGHASNLEPFAIGKLEDLLKTPWTEE